jgi:hypothetical protein
LFSENFDDAMYDILSSDDEKSEELKQIINQAEEESSEDGKEWSDSERESINKKIKELAPELFNKPGVSQSTKIENDLKIAISSAKTVISQVEDALSDRMYKPKNPTAASELKSKIKDLKSAISSEDINKIINAEKALKSKRKEADFRFSLNELRNLVRQIISEQ